jgi:catechol 2,3-dioxygenase-like lactoylglutathione lyase family enzyme
MPSLRITTVNIGAPEPRRLADFWQTLLGGEIAHDEGDFVILRLPDGQVALSFQREEFTAPTWPAGPGDQHMMMHLEVRVDDLQEATEHALACGARLAEHQPQDDVRVCIDPAGHPFCLWVES